jgi:hypothetical protein
MNQGKRLAYIISIVIILSVTGFGQRRPRPKTKPRPPGQAASVSPAPAARPVTVNLKEGDPVTGNFLRADAETVQVEIRSGQLAIKMSEVASLVFSEEGGAGSRQAEADRPVEAERKDANEQPAADPGLPAARKAYAALRKLAEAAKIKLPAGQYGNLLIEAKTVTDEALMEISDYSLKNEITRTLDAYYDAGQALGAARAYETRQLWNQVGVVEQRIPVDTEPGATLMRKYQIKPGVNRLGLADKLELDATLKTIWAVAAARLNYVGVLIRQ